MRFASIVAGVLALVASGCGVLLDFDPADPKPLDGSAPDLGHGGGDASTDGGALDAQLDAQLDAMRPDFGADLGRPDFGPDAPPDPCATLPDGTPCPAATGLVCVAGACVASTCGDGFVDTARGEQCEPAADTACNPGTCRWDCVHDIDCPTSGTPCLLVTCLAHVCTSTPAPMMVCPTAGGATGICVGGACAPPSCGNGMLDPGEQCDGGLGCTPDCHFECNSPSECSDGNGCDGIEGCMPIFGGSGTMVVGQRCVPGSPTACVSSDPCLVAMCVSTGPTSTDCPTTLIDGDGDGFPPSSIVGCGTDCNDANPFIHPGAMEICNGIDDDCNGVVDDGAMPTTWCRDADGDGFGDPTATLTSCMPPPGYVLDCTDCYDTGSAAGRANAAQVHPGQTSWFTSAYCTGPGTCSYDYDCSGDADLEFPDIVDCSLLLCAGRSGWVGPTVPACGAMAPLGTCHTLIRLLCNETTAPGTQGCH